MANLVELFDNIVQMQNLNGVPLAAGKLYVYALGRTRLMDTWSDVDGESLNPNPIILDDAGQAHVYVSDDFDYTLVVCDQYNNEIFSLDKYLYSKGSHSHADVAVAPSESIAVSSYHVGETTVYVPYLTGQLGKVYTGIDPIVVNNVEDKISANHVPLGVQDPLYFVQDDEEGCIIGFSGETLPEGTMNESAFGYQDGQITSYNGSAFSAGNSYEAGSYVDIDGNTINVTGLQPAGNYQSAGDYVSASELENLQPKGDYYSASNPSGFITGVDLTDYAKTEDLTAYQPVGDYYSASNPSGFINSDAISSMATTGFVADVSGDITALIPDTSDMATKTWVSSQGYLTAHQSLDGLMSADLLEISDNKITGYNGTAFAGQGGVTGDFELSAGSGISIVDYPLEQKTVISVTAQGGNPEVEQAVIDNSATWNIVTSKQDALTFGYHDTAISSINETAIYDNSAHARINTLVSRISDLSSNKLDTTAFSDVSGTFLTAHQDLSNYATTAQLADKVDSSAIGVKQVGSTDLVSSISGMRLSAMYAANADWASNASKATRDSLGNIITATYISGVPAGTMNESAFGYDANDKISGYNGSAFAGGSDVPEGVMVESGLEYNAVNEISAYNGSAIAQYGAEKQWLVHDDTLVHAANSAQYALGVNLSAVAQLLGVDETVIYENTTGATVNSANVITLNESLQNFEMIKIIDNSLEVGGARRLTIIPVSTATRSIATNDAWFDVSYNPTANASKYIGANFYSANDAGTQIRMNGSYISHMANTGAWVNRNDGHLYKIVGVHRISG